jgi:hypothetical protein
MFAASWQIGGGLLLKIDAILHSAEPARNGFDSEKGNASCAQVIILLWQLIIDTTLSLVCQTFH